MSITCVTSSRIHHDLVRLQFWTRQPNASEFAERLLSCQRYACRACRLRAVADDHPSASGRRRPPSLFLHCMAVRSTAPQACLLCRDFSRRHIASCFKRACCCCPCSSAQVHTDDASLLLSHRGCALPITQLHPSHHSIRPVQSPPARPPLAHPVVILSL